jgi:hypothetical protein
MAIHSLSEWSDLHQDFVVICDSCEDEDNKLECTTDHGFKGVTEFMKEQGWQVKKVGDEWLHFCPECKIDFDSFSLKLYGDN